LRRKNISGNAENQLSEQYENDNDQMDQYEQDRLTDDNASSEYFHDDFNAEDRFTSKERLERDKI
jgi:hypothetical protein